MKFKFKFQNHIKARRFRSTRPILIKIKIDIYTYDSYIFKIAYQ